MNRVLLWWSEWTCLSLALLWLAAAATGLASDPQMVPLSLGELTAQADWVVHGQVQSKSCRRDAAGRIVTRVEVDVIDVWKGHPSGARIEVALAGGTLGEKQVIVVGQPDYTPGEEVVLFLKLNPRGQGVTIGLAQGKFSVWRDRQTGTKYACSLFHGRAAVSADSAGAKERDRRLPLGELKQEVKRAQK